MGCGWVCTVTAVQTRYRGGTSEYRQSSPRGVLRHVLAASLGASGIGLVGRFPAGKISVYIVADVVGGIAASAVLYVIASGKAGFTLADGFASNGYGAHSPAGYTLAAAIAVEIVMTFFFLLVIHGVTDRRAPAGLVHRYLLEVPVSQRDKVEGPGEATE